MKVNAIIIGAGRSGTTSLYEYLKQHPGICFSSVKEVHYFSIEDLYRRGEKYLHSFFDKNCSDKICITADTYLLVDKEAPQRIKEYNPGMKILVLLREPVARAYSNYNYSVEYGHEKKNVAFLDTIALEPQRLADNDIVHINNLCHFYGSLYDQHLNYWMRFFPREQFLLLKTSDLQKDAKGCMQKTFSFLGVDDASIQTGIHYNKTSGAKSKWLQQFLLDRNTPLRKIVRLFLRPFRSLIIKTDWIQKLSEMNKKEIAVTPLSAQDLEKAKLYFKDDIVSLKKDLDVEF